MMLIRRDLLLGIVLPAAICVIVVAAGVFGWLLPEFEDAMLAQHRDAVQHQTDAAWSLVNRLYQRAQAGEITMEQAQRRAADALRHARYGTSGDDYFWVHDMDGTMLVHPYREDMEGKAQTDLQDIKGTYIIRDSIAAARSGGGFIRYYWQKQGQANIISPKLTYVRPFKPWGWVIATGVYLDEVESHVARMSARASWMLLGILFVVGLLLLSLVGRAIKVERERSDAEAARADSEAKYRMIVEHQQDIVLKIDPQGRFRYIGPSFTEVFGMTEEDAVGENFLHLVTEEDQSVATRALETVLQAPHAAYTEQRVKTVDGVRWYGWRNQAILDDDGKVESIVCVGRDITGRRTAEIAVRASEERLRSLVRVAPMGIAVMHHHILHDANDCLCVMLGYDRDELVGQSVRMFYESDERYDEIGRELQQQLEEKGASSLETQWVRKDGEVIDVLVNCTLAAQDGEPDNVIFTAVDITERKDLEAQLRQSQKMEAIGQLAGGVAHDFNNQLTIIRGYCDLITEDMDCPAAIREQLLQVENAAERAGRLTSQLLAFSRKQVLRPAVVNLCEVINDMHKPISRMVGEDIEITLECHKDASTSKLDRGQLEQAVINLAVNARDAMPRGGMLNIRISPTTIDDANPCEDLPTGEYVCLSVSDNGTGMDEHTRQHLFEPFFTTKEVGKGTGLGLSMVYGFVRQSSGAVRVDSEPGRGTTFELFFPAVGEPTAEPAEDASGAVTGGRETILVVEDEPAVRRLIARVLRDQGYEVIETDDTDDALAIGADLSRSIDMLVADVVMPGRSGPELAAEIIQARPGIGVLYVSGYLRGVAVRRGLVEANANILSKPFGPKELAAAVRDCLDQSAPHPAHPSNATP